MFKFETVVYVALVTAFSFPAWSQTPPAGRPDSQQLVIGNNRPSQCESFVNDMKTAAGKAAVLEAARGIFGDTISEKAAMDKYRRLACPQAAGATTESCRESEEKFNSASGKFSTACTNAGLNRPNPNPDGKGGSLHCAWQKNRCRCNSKNVNDEDRETFQCNKTEDRGRDRLQLSAQSNDSLGLIDLNKARKDLDFCPHEDPDDSERYEKQLEKAQERIKEAKKKLPELMNKGSEAQDRANQAENDARRKSTEAQKEFANEMKEIKRKKEGDEQQAVAEMTQAREKMDQLDAQIRQMELSKVDAEVKLSEAKNQVELNCHAMASQQVAANQTRRMADIQKGKPSGDFNKLMNSVGVSSRAAWEKVAERYYRRCLNSRVTRDSKKAAQNIYESTLRQVDSAISTARKQRASIEENLKQVMTTNGCGAAPMQANGMTGESRMCRSLRQAQEDSQQAYQNQVMQQQQIQQEAITAKQQQATKNQALSMEYAEAQREINDEQRRLENLRAYLNLKRERSNGIGGKKEAAALGDAYGGLEAAAENIVSCKNKDEGEITDETYKKAFDFLKSIGREPPGIPEEITNRRNRTNQTRETPRTNDPPAPTDGVRERRPGG